MRLVRKRRISDEAIEKRLVEHEQQLHDHERRLARVEHLRRERDLFDPRRRKSASE